jgi:hypothetical protein
MKSHIRWSKCSGSTKRKIEEIVRAGARASRRSVSSKRRDLIVEKGGWDES